MPDDDTPGVTSTDSPSDTGSLTAEDLRTAESTPAPDRPMQNVIGEFNRKYGQLNQKLDGILNWINTQAQMQQVPSAAAPTQQSGEVSDEDLWRLAQQGDRSAFETYQRRIADRQLSQRLQAASFEQTVEAQLGAILRAYPVLNDAGHPLTQTVNQAYQLLVRRGYPPNRATMLDAAKTAIADRPDLVSELHTQGAQASQQARRTAAQAAQSGATGVSYRHDATPQAAPPKPLSAAELALAKRMGVKDPAKSKQRFLQRQQDGISTIDPKMIGAVSQEEF